MKTISIYIVEDELLISASLKSQLQQFGYEVCGSAMSGENSLVDIEELSSQGREPEIVLMDIHLRGGMDGIETARIITEKFNCAIIFLTGQSSKEVYERSFKIKPFGYLLKPIDMEQTKMTVEIAAYQRNLEIENDLYQKDLEALLEKRSQENKELMVMYQTVTDNSLLGLTIFQDEKFVFVNNRTAEIFGYTPEEFQFFSIHDILGLLHPEDKEKVISISRARLNGVDILEQTHVRILTRDKQTKHLETVVRAIQFNGKPALHQTFLDITDYCYPR
ncbi:MAG: response regulator [Bacteroidota bacterium]